MLQIPNIYGTQKCRAFAMTRGVFLSTWLATGALAFAATQLLLTLTLPAANILSMAQLPSLTALSSEATDAQEFYEWPALFGAPAVVEADKPKAEPIVSATYTLKGLIAGLDTGWAILTDGAREIMVREGDQMDDGSVVVRIDRHGVVLDLNDQLINVSFGTAVPSRAAQASAETAQPTGQRPVLPSHVNLDISELNTSDIRRMLGRAGAVTQIELPDGTKALDVLWIRNGQLYDKLGLEAGDRLMTINGIAAGDNQALIKSTSTLLSSDEYDLEIIRNGTRQAVTVTLQGND